MIEIILCGIIAGLYVLGKWQGGAVLEVANDYLLEEGQEPMEGMEEVLMTWGWPIATAIAMFQEAKDGTDGK